MSQAVSIKVFGERNTATRAVIRMIDAADGVTGTGRPGVTGADLRPFREMAQTLEGITGAAWRKVYREAVRDLQDDVLGPVGAWKHAAPVYAPDFVTHGVAVLFTIRNPYSWALALHRRPYHQLGHRVEDFEGFLRQPWLSLGRDRVDKILGSPMDLWSLKLKAYLEFERQAAIGGTRFERLSFEDFVLDPAKSLGAALSALAGREVEVEELEGSTKKGGLDGAGRRHYYASEGWRDGLTASAVAHINARIDWAVAAQYGYAPLDPRDFPDVLEPA